MSYIKVTKERGLIGVESEGDFIELIGMVEWLKVAFSKRLLEVVNTVKEDTLGKEEHER